MQNMKTTETYEEYLSRMELYRLLAEGLASGNPMDADEFFAAFWKEKEDELQRRSLGSRKG